MNLRRWIVLGVCVAAVMAAVWCLGDDWGDEGREFLRALRRVL
ncbi:hypothetical protein [Vulcaniibacterium tengchongense]|nr:hypothetical protein [Vulcaniibacterium tengchongense]